jgi:quinohemoprotein ethanol dehydrogenase
VDPGTGRPVETPQARYDETPVLLAPHAGGAHNFNPMSYSPATGLVYFPVVQSWGIYAAAPAYAPGRGTGTAFMGHDTERKRLQEYAEAHTTAWLVAWDPVQRREAWRVPYPRDGSGGALATAGNLVIQGTIDRTLAIYRADTGAKLWEMPVQNVAIAGPITYSVDGEQYIAVNAGWGGGLAHFERAAGRGLNVSAARLLVFKLGGTAELPPLPDAPPLEEPPMSSAPEATIQAGAVLYAQYCALCHGALVRGGIRDLRQMTAATHREFNDILLRGTRAQAGMASFAGTLGPEDVEAIHAYVIARAREDWGTTH